MTPIYFHAVCSRTEETSLHTMHGILLSMKLQWVTGGRRKFIRGATILLAESLVLCETVDRDRDRWQSFSITCFPQVASSKLLAFPICFFTPSTLSQSDSESSQSLSNKIKHPNCKNQTSKSNCRDWNTQFWKLCICDRLKTTKSLLINMFNIIRWGVPLIA